MELWQSLVLGLVEGITEYLPVSSTGHLLLTERAMGIANSESANAYAICIQAGAILAVFAVFWPRVKEMTAGLLGKNPVGRALAINVIIGFVPAGLIGALVDKHIEHYLFGLWPVVAAWLVGGVVILLVNPRTGQQGLNGLSHRQALIIGVAQCLAMWPGTSRSLATIIAGVLVGLTLEAAVEFSFLLGLVTLGAATVYKLLKSGGAMLHAYGTVNLVIGFVVAAVSAWIAVRWLVSYLNRHGLRLFGWYRLALGLVTGGLILAGVIAP